jgi:hypothetical protein
LYTTRGEWDFAQTPKITMQGINSSSICDMMFEARFIPGEHITSEYKSLMKVPEDFGVTMQFHIQKSIESFKGFKRELPDDVRTELQSSKFCLADPNQAEDGCDTLIIHGIIGEDMINELEESTITKIGDKGLKVTRTLFGDIIHGKSHHIKFPYRVGGLELKEEQEFAANEEFCQYGIVPVFISGQNDIIDQKDYEYLQNICE